MEKIFKSGTEFVAVGAKSSGSMTVVFETICSEESFEEIFAKITHD
jgi:hypothetical protein